MSNSSGRFFKAILTVVTVCRYLFGLLAFIGLAVSFESQADTLGMIFYERRTYIFVFTYLISEASYWALKYRKLLDETTGKASI